jgi:hypothetical protein
LYHGWQSNAASPIERIPACIGGLQGLPDPPTLGTNRVSQSRFNLIPAVHFSTAPRCTFQPAFTVLALVRWSGPTIFGSPTGRSPPRPSWQKSLSNSSPRSGLAAW